jgi:hypothetical protein
MNVWLQLTSTMLVGVLTAGGALLGVRMNGRVGDRATEQRAAQCSAVPVHEPPARRAASMHRQTRPTRELASREYGSRSAPGHFIT